MSESSLRFLFQGPVGQARSGRGRPSAEPQSGHAEHVDDAAGGPGGYELVRSGLLVCGDCDMTSLFRIGVDLMIRGLDAYLDTLPTETAAAG